MNSFLSRLVFVVVIFFSCHVNAQSLSSSVVNSGGGSVEHPGFSLLFSIGEPVLVSTASPQPWAAGFISTLSSAPITSVESEEEVYIQCYPVPVSKNLTIEKKNEHVIVAAIHSLRGIKVMEVVLVNNTTEIDVSHLMPGVYIIAFRTKLGVTKIQRLVKI